MTRKSSPLTDLLISVVLPSVILMKFSGEEHLGSQNGLIVALAFPIIYGLYEFIRFRETNYIAILGFVSVLLTGGIGLLKLDNQWLAVKEAAVPGVIGLAVLISTFIGKPLIRVMLFNPKVMDVDKITAILQERQQIQAFEQRLLSATYLLAGTFFFSAVMNYILATWIVTSPAGSEAFNEELGQLTLVSYPVIAIPSTVMMLLIFYFLYRKANKLTDLKLEDMLAPELRENK